MFLTVTLDWIESGYRQRNKVDAAHDRVRWLPLLEKAKVVSYLTLATKQ